MIKDEDIPELEAYRSFENLVPFTARTDYESLVVFGRNDIAPVHSWFRFKEGFSANLLRTILHEFSAVLPSQELSLLDPFCGSGTTLLSAQRIPDKKIKAVGIERSPFIHFIAKTKCSWQSLNFQALLDDGRLAIEYSEQFDVALPALTSISKGRCISKHIASRLMAIDHAAQLLPANSPFVRLGIASAIEPLSKIRRDGRALRIVAKPRKLVNSVLSEIWTKMAEDARSLDGERVSAGPAPVVKFGDGRNPLGFGIQEHSVDLIVTSPPYPNNIDYSEVYKLELWILGFIKTKEDFLDLRHSTIRSHPTFNKHSLLNEDFLKEVATGKLDELLGAVTKRLEKSGERWRSRMLLAYFSDLWNAVENYKRVLTENGMAVFVIGNSLHGTEAPAMIASDLVLARIGECHGFKAHISVARGLKRRLAGNHFLRESVVVLKRQT
jgi:SAM-dependent methyltransferase